MAARIIYCPPETLVRLAKQPHKELRRLDGGACVEVGNDVLQELLYWHPSTPILYFSRQTYEHAVRRLPEPELDNVLRKRIQSWAPRAHENFLNWLYLRGRQCLSLTAVLRSSAKGNAPALLDRYFDQTLQILASIAGGNRYDGVDLTSMLDWTLEDDAKVLEEQRAAREAARRTHNSVEEQRIAPEIAARERFARSLASLLRARDPDEYDETLPHIDLTRGVFITPRDGDMVEGLHDMHETFAPWKEGLVTRWPVRTISNLEAQGKQVRVLYMNPGKFLEDLFELTQAQLHREFEERAGGDKGSSEPARAEYLNFLRLEQNLLRRNLGVIARQQDAKVALVVEKQIAEETSILKSALAQQPSWILQLPGERGERIRLLKGTQQDLLEDAMFFETQAVRAGNRELQSDLEAVIKAFKGQAEALNSLSEKDA